MENEEYIKKWIDGTLSEEERNNFEKTETYHSLQKLSKSLQAFQAPDYNIQMEWVNLQAKRSGRGRASNLNWIKPLLRVAAVVVMLFAVYFVIFQDKPTILKTIAAETAEITLPDSSHAIINAFSRLTFYEKKWNKKRTVKLEGEAFFKVTTGSTFDVETGSGIISVLGTQFNVKNREDYFEVICYEGLVKVKSKGEEVKLSPHHVYRVLNGTVSKFSILRDNAPSWIINESSFQSIPFILVIREFERQYDKTVITKNVDLGQLFTGRFVNSDISLALRSITLPLNLAYRIDEDHNIILTGDNN